MDATSIAEIARQITDHLQPKWSYWLLVACIGGLAGALGAFGGSFLRKRGETSALKADLDEIARQQAKIAGDVATVQTAVSHSDWKQRTVTTLRQERLEALVDALVDCDPYVLDTYHSTFITHQVVSRANPMHKVNSLATLYFPELSPHIDVLGIVQTLALKHVHAERIRPGPNGQISPQGHIDPVSGQHIMQSITVVLAQVQVVLFNARGIMDELLGLPARPSNTMVTHRDQTLRDLEAFQLANSRPLEAGETQSVRMKVGAYP